MTHDHAGTNEPDKIGRRQSVEMEPNDVSVFRFTRGYLVIRCVTRKEANAMVKRECVVRDVGKEEEEERGVDGLQ